MKDLSNERDLFYANWVIYVWGHKMFFSWISVDSNQAM